MSTDIENSEHPASVVEEPTPSTPRTRWAAIIWGAVFVAISVSAIALLVDGNHGEVVGEWVMSLTPASITAIALLAIGAVILICGAIGLIRRLQRRAESA